MSQQSSALAVPLCMVWAKPLKCGVMSQNVLEAERSNAFFFSEALRSGPIAPCLKGLDVLHVSGVLLVLMIHLYFETC